MWTWTIVDSNIEPMVIPVTVHEDAVSRTPKSSTEEAKVMKKLRACLVVLAIALFAHACALSCGPGPGRSTEPVTYPGSYTIEIQNEKAPAK